MRKVKVEEAVGTILGHDMTRIVPGEYKGVAFKKGHIIQADDIELMKNMGKFHVYVHMMEEGMYHENEGAKMLAEAIAGPHVVLSEAAEGKVNLTSKIKGKLSIDLTGLDTVNGIEGVICATRHRDTVVEVGDIVAGAKIIPLVIDKEALLPLLEYVRENGPIIQVNPFHRLKTGILVTGSEVYYGRIKDAFAPVLEGKITEYGGEVIAKRFAPDDEEHIIREVKCLREEGAELILISGGMSVDPDDVTPSSIRSIATEVVTYGSPVLPGAMFMVAYDGEVPLLGVPACGMFSKTTVLDLMLPYIFAKERITKKMIIRKAHGGLCLGCEVCSYPHCAFGKG